MRTVSVLVHGHEWPDPSWARELREVLAVPPGAGPVSVVDVIDVRENASRAEGAAAALNRVVQRVTSDAILVVEAGCRWDRRLLADLGAAVFQWDVLAIATPSVTTLEGDVPARAWNDAWIPTAIGPTTELPGLIDRAIRVGLDEWAWQLHASRPRLWAARTATFRALGGLDPAFWSVGLLEDLADRADARGVSIKLLEGPATADSPHDAWPLRPHIRQFLALRGVLLSAMRGQTVRRAGRSLAVTSALAIAEAWRQAGIASGRLEFGGSWGRGHGFADRFRSSQDQTLKPARGAAMMLPLLALDSFLDLLITRISDPAHAYAGVAEAELVPAAASPKTPPLPELAPLASQALAEAVQERLPIPLLGDATLPAVSVIVVNWNGKEHLQPCLASLLASDYPADRLHIIFVDNGSTDGSREFVASQFPAVKVVALAENRGFTGGNAAGVHEATGDVLVFFNNDMRVEPGAVRTLVSALSDEFPCAAAVVRSWNGRHIDFVRGSLNFEGHGFQDHYGEPWRPERAMASETFFPNGGAFAIRRKTYLEAGGFDEHFFAYYDDVDLGYGIRQTGGRVRVVPDAHVYHRHGATSRRYPQGQKRFLMERNALATVLKRYEPSTLDRSLGAVLLLATRRIAQETVLRRRHPLVRSLAGFSGRCRARPQVAAPIRAALLYEHAPPPGGRRSLMKEEQEAPIVVRTPMESVAALGEALAGLGRIIEQRQRIARQRRCHDGEIFPAMGRPLAYGSPLASYQAAHDALVEGLHLAEVFRSRPRLLIITHEPLRARMSGPGVRVLELGRALADAVRVTIATPVPPEISDDRCTLAAFDPSRSVTLRRLAEDADVLLVQGFTLSQFPFLAGMHIPIAVDLYCPFTVEYLEMKTAEARSHGAGAPDVDVQMEAVSILEVQNAQLRHGDFFICASERQRDFWIGALHTSGRVNPQTYASDTSLRGLVDLVPFGVPEQDFEEAVASARRTTGPLVMKGHRPGIGTDDKVLYWGGSLLDWQDPLTLIRAVAHISRTRRDVKLFFAGTRHPNPQVAPMQIVDASMALARDLGVLDTSVFFNDWIRYDERAAYLAESDLGLSTHRL
ncbi:MAG: glycosyltransferase, partial [Vicinamibacterales bacterium]